MPKPPPPVDTIYSAVPKDLEIIAVCMNRIYRIYEIYRIYRILLKNIDGFDKFGVAVSCTFVYI